MSNYLLETMLQNQTVNELRILAKKLDIAGYSGMRKDELIKTLSKAQKKKAKAEAKKASQNKSRKKAETKTALKIKAKTPITASKKRMVSKKASVIRKIPLTAPEVTVIEKAAPIEATTLGDELRVEDAKYVTAQPGTQLATDYADDLGEDLDNLPLLKGPRLTLLPQKPGIFHASWVLSPEHLTQKSSLHLRLLSLSCGAINLFDDILLPTDRDSWYFHIDPKHDVGKIYLQLGSYNENNDFVIAIERGIVRIPRLGASPNTDRRWWISEEEFRRLYLAAGGCVEGGHLLWSTHRLGSWQGRDLGGLRNLSSW